jgi:hypothetical protein
VIKKFFDATNENVQRFNQEIDQEVDEKPKKEKPEIFKLEVEEKIYPSKEPDLSNPVYLDPEVTFFVNK